MRARSPLLSAVLALAILAGQWLTAAHNPDHAVQAGGADACAVCVYAHGAGAGPVSVAPALPLLTGAAAPAIHVASGPLAATVRNHPIRGPPALLA